MTSFIAWRAGSPDRPASLYFASDSRRSWRTGETRDDCVKLFSPANSPDIFGMVGEDITLPEGLLPELCDAMDNKGALPGKMTSAYGRNEWVRNLFQERIRKDQGCFDVFHGARNHCGNKAVFLIFHLQYLASEGRLMSKELDFPGDGSCAIAVQGSGAGSIRSHVQLWTDQVGKYSRSYFSGFCDSLCHPESDPLSGGPPQLIALGNTGRPLHLGIVTAIGRFYRGRSVSDTPPGVKWRNDQFEVVDSQGRLLKRAQPQPRPRPLLPNSSV
jgi:hypothetical protein